MSSVTAVPNSQQPALNRPNKVSVGTIVWLSSELMFFAGIFAMYFSIRATVPELWPVETAKLTLPFAIGNTMILVLSSVTCQFGVFAAERFQRSRTGSLFNVARWGMQEWFILTYLMGATFVAGQIYEYAELVEAGLTISSSPYGSVFFFATGFHGLHVIGGLIAFLFVLGRAYSAKRFGQHEATFAIVASYYWHFVDVVWIGMFWIIYIIQ